MTIGIIGGKGKMGSYLASFFTSLGYKVIISDLKTKLSNKDLAEQSDVVIVSVPIDKTVSTIEKITPHLKQGALLIDVTSIKEAPVKAMKKAKCEVVGTHPLFAPINGMKNQVIILTPVKGTKGLNWLKKTLKQGGAILKIMTPKEHDELMTIVQGLTHSSDIALAYAFKQLGIPLKNLLPFQSPSYRLKLDTMGRILAQDSKLYANIQIQNAGNLKTTTTFLKAVEKLHRIIKKKDSKAFQKYFAAGSNYLGSFKKQAMQETNQFITDILNKGDERAFDNPKDANLALLGPQNSYSDLAASERISGSKKYYCRSLPEIFRKLSSGAVEYGLCPIENSLTGAVAGVLEQLLDHKKLEIIEEIALPIKHCLAGLKKLKTSQIKKLLSHQQALLQCSPFIQKHLSKADIEATTSTAAGVRKLLQENLQHAAVICSETAAKEAGLTIIKKNITRPRKNVTRFIVLRKKKRSTQEAGNYKTSLALMLKKDYPGSLANVLAHFSKNKINLTRLESRPAQDTPGNYIFFIDCEGHQKDAPMQKVLKELKKISATLNIFGSYLRDSNW